MSATADLVGREPETRVLDALVDGVHEHGGSLVLRGEPGIGKSALLTAAGGRAADRGMRVLRTAGVQSETRLPFAGLHQLLRPVLGEAGELPDAQRDALHAAFGLTDAAAPELFRIALAVLDLLAESAGRTPILAIAEDVHWLDRSTSDVLAFVARRVQSDPIVVLAASRDGSESSLVDAGLPELRLAELDDIAAATLLDAHAPGLSSQRRARVLEAAAGNPLALVELPRASEQLDDGTALPAWLPLTTRLEQAFAARISELPTDTRALLVVAAVDDEDALAEVLGAAALIVGADVGVHDLEPAEAAGLIDLGETTLRFRHPVVRSAIRQATSVAQRHDAHAALAEVLAGKPDRRVWHRVGSAVGPDEDVARELDAAATRAVRRGAIVVAVAALEHAARLTEEPTRRGDRLLSAAELAFEMGRHDVVLRLLHDAGPLELGPLELPRLSWLREVFEDGRWTGAAKAGAFVEIADRMRLGGDTDRALSSLLTVALRCWWDSPGQETRDLIVAAAERIPVPPDDAQLIAILAFASPIDTGAVVIDRLSRLTADASGDPEALRLWGTAATGVGAFDQAPRFLEAAVAGLRAQGRLGLLARALVSRGLAGIFVGSWSDALAAAEEAGRLARETAQPTWLASAQAVEATLAGLRGDEHSAEALAAEAERVLLPMGAAPVLALVQLARGAGALTAGRHADAYDALQRIFDPSDIVSQPYVRHWAVADLVDAAVHSGHHDEARAAVRALEADAARARSPLLRVALAYARALLAEDDDAEARFQAALGADLAAWPFIRARLLLAHGAWLRRQRRVAESRAPLRAALEAFEALGAAPWGERARQELRASGETSRRRTPAARDDLTPQELQIARMAADGLSNRDIGQRLYLSHRTIGSHLYRIFPKLGVTSRADLHAALDAAGAPSPGG
jgi:DNA-binding CsgD family transcriptional regulator